MEPVAYYTTQAGTQVPVFDPADLDSAPIRFKLDGQLVAFMLTTDIASATNAEINFVFDGTRYAATGVDDTAAPTLNIDFWSWEIPTAGEEYEVTADITNVGVGTQPGDVTYELGGADVASTSVELNPNESTTVSFTVTAPPIAGNYDHRLYTAADEETGTVTVEGEPEWSVTSIDPEDFTVTRGDPISVSATLENTGTDSGDAEARYYLDERHADTDTIPNLGVGETGTVDFSTTAAEEPGSYTHEAWTDHDGMGGTITIESDAIIVDDYQHDQLASYYQGGTGDHYTTTEWAEEGGRSLASNDPNSAWMRSFPQGNSFRSHGFSFDRYPQQGDTIRVVTRASEHNDTGYNSNGHTFRFKFNCGAISNDITYRHQMSVIDPYHELEDRYVGSYTSEPVPATFEPGDVIAYVFEWNMDDTVTISIERNGETMPGTFTESISSEASNAGFGISLRGEGGDSMLASHIELEE